jgi:hypothetical protein
VNLQEEGPAIMRYALEKVIETLSNEKTEMSKQILELSKQPADKSVVVKKTIVEGKSKQLTTLEQYAKFRKA